MQWLGRDGTHVRFPYDSDVSDEVVNMGIQVENTISFGTNSCKFHMSLPFGLNDKKQSVVKFTVIAP